MKLTLAIAFLIGALGCSASKPGVALSRAATVTLPPVPNTMLYQWRNNNCGDSNVVTGLVSSTNLALPMEQWLIRCQTNCAAETNSCTLPIAKPQEFIRAYNRSL